MEIPQRYSVLCVASVVIAALSLRNALTTTLNTEARLRRATQVSLFENEGIEPSFTATKKKKNVTLDHKRQPHVRHATNSRQQRASKPKRKKFIVHVGPGKTATTSLQCALLTSNLEHYEYLGKLPLDNRCGEDVSFVPKLDLRSCMLPKDPADCWNQLPRLLRHHNTSLIVSQEELSLSAIPRKGMETNEFWEMLRNILDMSGYDLTIVVTYRRYADWLRSNENHYGIALQQKGWETGRKALFAQLQEWMLESDTDQAYGRYPYTQFTLNKLSNFSQHMHVLNVHDPRGPIRAFICDVLVEETSLCLHFKENPIRHASVPTEFDLLSLEAYRLGWIHNRTRIRVANLAQKHHMKGNTTMDFPLICPSREELLSLLQRTLEYEQNMFPQLFVSTQDAIEANFWKQVEERKFCSVDAQRVLAENEDWRRIFQSIGRRRS